jgi:hypothetical protein
MTSEICYLPICWAGFRWARSHGYTEGALLDGVFSKQRIRLKKQLTAYRVTSLPRQRIQKRFRSHGNEPPKHSNREERCNSTVEGGDVYTVRGRVMKGEFARLIHSSRVEAGSNTSTVDLRVVGGDKKMKSGIWDSKKMTHPLVRYDVI